MEGRKQVSSVLARRQAGGLAIAILGIFAPRVRYFRRAARARDPLSSELESGRADDKISIRMRSLRRREPRWRKRRIYFLWDPSGPAGD